MEQTVESINAQIAMLQIQASYCNLVASIKYCTERGFHVILKKDGKLFKTLLIPRFEEISDILNNFTML